MQLRQGGYQGMMAIGAGGGRESHRGPFKKHCSLVPSSETKNGWKEVS